METSEFSLCSWAVKYLNIYSSILSEELGMIWWNMQWLPETLGTQITEEACNEFEGNFHI